jgi:hypothetical protein
MKSKYYLKDEKVTGYLCETAKQEMKDLTVEEEKISFKIDFEGGLIDFKLKKGGEKLNGTVLTTYGEFPAVAVRAPKN